MTDKEIYEAYECCITGGVMTMSSALRCGECPYFHRKECASELKINVLGLLHRQQVEIEKLKKDLQTLTDILESGANSYEPVFEEDKIRAEAIKEFVTILGKRFEHNSELTLEAYHSVMGSMEELGTSMTGEVW